MEERLHIRGLRLGDVYVTIWLKTVMRPAELHIRGRNLQGWRGFICNLLKISENVAKDFNNAADGS